MARIKRLSDSGMRIDEIDNLLDQSEPLPPTEPPTEQTDTTITALATFNALLDTQHQIAQTLAGLADVAALVAQIAVLNERVTRLERAAHKHPWGVPTRAID